MDDFKDDYNLSKLKLIRPKRRDFQMKVAPRYLSHFVKNSYEDFTSDLVLGCIQNRILFIDIGAHYGYYTLLVGTKYPNSRILSFEPVAENYEILRQNLELNQLKHVEIRNLAVSNKNEPREFNITEASDSCGFYEHPLTHISKVVKLDAVTLDSQLIDMPAVPIIIKIDVEGHEVAVLDGMRHILENALDIILFIEFNPDCLKKAGYEPRELLDRINYFGFDIYFIDDERRWACKFDKRITDWQIYVNRADSQKYYSNLLCIKKDRPLSDRLLIILSSLTDFKKLREAKTELREAKTELREAKTELREAKTELRETKTELRETKTELNKVQTEYESYLLAIENSWSWRITSPLRFVFILKREVTIRRVLLALKHLFRGEIGIVREGILAIGKKSQEKPPDDITLNDAMSLFRHDAGDDPSLDQEVDIIIPIYNGIPYLTKLFDSLLRNTDSPYRLIMVDDASSDTEIQPFLQNIVQQLPNSVLIRNSENKGYVQSVNTALQHARNHFVLLNTDVEVPKGWLQRLMRPIVEDASIASTTPFTNAGTVCSFPRMKVDNDPFDNLMVDEIDTFFKLVNPEAVSIELPSGVGFCMGMNLDVWQQIGPFNERIFGSGYGEENDWSMRACAAGYRNVMVPNLFVYHKSGASFGQETKERQQSKNLPKVLKLHPSYQQEVNELIERDPAKPIRQFLTLLLSTHQASAGTTVFIDHQWGGGANTYRQEVIRERLKKGEAILLFTYDIAYRCFKIQCLYKEYNTVFTVSGFDDILPLLERVPCKEIFYNNLVTVPQPLDILNKIYYLKKNSRVDLTIAVHDYFCICPSYTLLNHSGAYCDLPNLEACRTCLPRNQYVFNNDSIDIESWRKTWGDILEVADTVLCFSESSRTLLTRTYTLKPEQIIVKPHQLPIKFNRKPKIDLNWPMNIGIFGGIGYQKGSEIVVEMARLLENEATEAKIIVIGSLSNVSKQKNLMVTGQYETSELPDLIEKYGINICFFPSIWPETFSYVCSELMELGMPLCCFELGAQGERVSKYRFGHIIPRISASAAAEEIVQFFASLKVNGTLKR